MCGVMALRREEVERHCSSMPTRQKSGLIPNPCCYASKSWPTGTEVANGDKCNFISAWRMQNGRSEAWMRFPCLSQFLLESALTPKTIFWISHRLTDGVELCMHLCPVPREMCTAAARHML